MAPDELTGTRIPETEENKESFIDLCAIGKNDPDFEVRFLDTLMEKIPFEWHFQNSSSLLPALKTIVASSEQSLTLSYPLFRRHTSEGLEVLPIINLSLSWTEEEDGSVIVFTDRSEPARIEPAFRQLVKDGHGQLLSDILDQVLDPENLQAESLQQLANELIVLMKLDDTEPFMGLKPYAPIPESHPHPYKKDKILWSGIVHNGDPLKYRDSLLDPLEGEEPEQPENSQGKPSESAFQNPEWREHHFHPFPMDADQARVIMGLKEYPEILVKGVSGTGKTNLLTSIVTNTLSQGQRILVVARDLPAMARIFAKFQETGLDDLCLMIKDAEIDRNYFVEKVRQIPGNLKNRVDYDEDEYDLKISQGLREFRRLQKGYQDLNRPIYLGQNWLTLVGKFLHKHNQQARTLLNSELSPEGFDFDENEFRLMTETIMQSEHLFLQLNTLKHPLEVLHEGIFLENSDAEALEFVNFQVRRFENEGVTLFHRLIALLENYGQDLINHYTEYYESLQHKAILILEDIEDYVRQYGEDFSDDGTLKNTQLYLQGIFSQRSKNILGIKRFVQDQHGRLVSEHKLRNYFPFQFTSSGGSSGFESLKENLTAYLEALENWKQEIARRVDQELAILNSDQIHNSLKAYSSRIKDLEKAFPDLIERINKAGFYKDGLTPSVNTLEAMLQYLSGVVDQVEVVKHNLQDFQEYYHWKNYWLSLQSNQQRLIEALIEVRPSDWLVAYESWFYHHLLENNYTVHIPRSDRAVSEFSGNQEALRKLIPTRIHAFWQYQQSEVIRTLKKDHKELYQKFFGKKSIELIELETLESLFLENFEASTTFFPILLCTPESGIPIMPEGGSAYDICVLDNAENMLWESARILMNQAPQKVVFGNPFGKYLPPEFKDYPTLMEMAEATTYKTFDLHFFHPSVNPFVLLVNQLLYNFTLKMFPQKDYLSAIDVRFVQVNGTFEEADEVNLEEASQVLGLLAEIKPEPKTGLYPRTGIVCMTQGQKAFIEQYIRKIKFEKSSGHEVVDRLERHGLEVCLIDQINQYRFEAILLSCTYDSHAQVSGSSLPYLDTALGFNAIQNLCLYPFRKLLICNSMMPDLLNMPAQPHPARNLLGKFLQIAEDIASQRFGLLGEKLRTDPTLSDEKQSAHILLNEVMNELGQYVDSSRFRAPANTGSLRLDLVIDPLYEKQQPIAVRCDGFYTRQQDGAYSWDQELISRLEAMGYVYYNLWSTNWWRKPFNASTKLVSFVLQHDKKYDREPPLISLEELESQDWDST